MKATQYTVADGFSEIDVPDEPDGADEKDKLKHIGLSQCGLGYGAQNPEATTAFEVRRWHRGLLDVGEWSNAIDIFDREWHVALILCPTPTDFLKCLIEIHPLVALGAKDDLDTLKTIAAKLFREFHGHHWYSDCKKCAE